MKNVIAFGLALVCASALASSPRADWCYSPGLYCLFVDAAECGRECPEGTCCVIKGAYCAFGFGVDAVCKCKPCAPHGL